MTREQDIEEALLSLKIPCSVVGVATAPQIMRYRLLPGNFPYASSNAVPRKIRVSEIRSRLSDIELAIGVPGISLRQNGELWLEIPRDNPDPVYTERLVQLASKATVPAIIGTSVAGGDIIVDLALPSTPHVLVGGATGSGKSTCINSILAGIILTKTPQQVGICLADPKYIELDKWNVEHLVYPIANELYDINTMLEAIAVEMDDRYMGHGGIDSEHIVVVIDEFADLIIRNRDAIEDLIIRIAQKGRAAGIHLIIATQRPSADIVTGAIKANFPVRVAFALPSQVDSRVIIDTNGAEKLGGYGDGLIKMGLKTLRFQGAITQDVDTAIEGSLGAPRYALYEEEYVFSEKEYTYCDNELREDEYQFTEEDWEPPAEPQEEYTYHSNSNDGVIVAAGVGLGLMAGLATVIVTIFKGVFVFLEAVFDN